jgi:hypothetical protein
VTELEERLVAQPRGSEQATALSEQLAAAEQALAAMTLQVAKSRGAAEPAGPAGPAWSVEGVEQDASAAQDDQQSHFSEVLSAELSSESGSER